MIWLLSKARDEMSINAWVRFWLRSGVITRFLIVLVVTALVAAMWMLIWLLGAGIGLLAEARDLHVGSTCCCLGAFPGILAFLPSLFLLVDILLDRVLTSGDIKSRRSSPNVVLATRAEYIGGHPQLPHGRFVYLVLGGTLQCPEVRVVLPQAEDTEAVFSMPVVDVERTKERTVTEQTAESFLLASVTQQSGLLSRRSLLNIEYNDGGHRHLVELGRFFGGDQEVQKWRNHIVCIQAEAETGQRPFGPWKSLPSRREGPAAS